MLRELQPLLHLDCLTVTGETLAERLASPAGPVDRAVVKPLAEPLQPMAGSSRCSARWRHTAPSSSARPPTRSCSRRRAGRSCSSLDDLAARIDDPALDVTPDDLLVLQNAGPLAASGMPEAGYLPIPQKLARAGSRTWCGFPMRG